MAFCSRAANDMGCERHLLLAYILATHAFGESGRVRAKRVKTNDFPITPSSNHSKYKSMLCLVVLLAAAGVTLWSQAANPSRRSCCCTGSTAAAWSTAVCSPCCRSAPRPGRWTSLDGASPTRATPASAGSWKVIHSLLSFVRPLFHLWSHLLCCTCTSRQHTHIRSSARVAELEVCTRTYATYMRPQTHADVVCMCTVAARTVGVVVRETGTDAHRDGRRGGGAFEYNMIPHACVVNRRGRSGVCSCVPWREATTPPRRSARSCTRFGSKRSAGPSPWWVPRSAAPRRLILPPRTPSAWRGWCWWTRRGSSRVWGPWE